MLPIDTTILSYKVAHCYLVEQSAFKKNKEQNT